MSTVFLPNLGAYRGSFERRPGSPLSWRRWVRGDLWHQFLERSGPEAVARAPNVKLRFVQRSSVIGLPESAAGSSYGMNGHVERFVRLPVFTSPLEAVFSRRQRQVQKPVNPEGISG